jgi:hypothetical protein
MKTLNTFLLLVCAFATHAQTSIYVGGGPSAGLSGAAFNITTGICDATSTNCALINYAASGSVRDLKSITYTTTASARRVLATVAAGKGAVDLFGLFSAGAAVNGSGPSFTGAGGGGLTFHPGSAPNWGFTVAAQGAYDSQNKAHPDVYFQAGYTFRQALK